MSTPPASGSTAELAHAAAEVERHVAAAGWDRPPQLFGLVSGERLWADDPAAAQRLGVTDARDRLIPVEQDPLGDGDLDVALARIAWPEPVIGAVLAQEILILPPSADVAVRADDLASAAAHPDRREARLVVAVLRDGPSAALLRLRSEAGGADDDLLTGPDLAPNLTAALLATFEA